MALNDIIVPKENAQGDFTETVLTPAEIGAQPAGNYATLVGGTVPANQLPSYVDDVIEVANAAARPNPGETGKIYITTDNNKVFRWSGSAYVEIVASPGSTDAVPEGSTNLYHTTQRAAAAAPVQSVAGRTGAVTLAVADVSGAVASTDSRLTDARTPTSHTHGNITNDGKIGTTANLPVKTGTNGVLEAGSFSNAAGTFCEGNDPRLSDARTPSSTLAHASSHEVGSFAIFKGQASGMTADVTIIADNIGTNGNSIELSFDGVDTINTVLSAWNAVNTSNTATLSVGDGTQIPDNAELISLAGGEVGGSDPLVIKQLDSQPSGEINKFKLGLGGDSATGRFVGVTTAEDPLIGILSYEDENAYNANNEVVSSQYGMTLGANNSIMFAQYLNNGGVQAQYNFPNTGGVVAVLENEGDGIPSLDISQLTEARSIAFPDANGTIALTADIPSTFAASAITSGTLTHERGGLEADVSAYNGLVKISGGATSAVTVTAAGEALLDDVDAAAQRTTLGLGTAATSNTGDFAAASHSHGNLTSAGAIGSTAGLPVVTTTSGAVTTLALGSANQVLKVNSGGTAVEFGAAGGVTSGSVDNAVLRADGTGGSTSQSSDIIIDDATTTTQNNVAITNQHSGQTNSALVLTPKGNLGISAGPRPNGAAAGGNARGQYAIDLQLLRASASQVASGNYSVIAGGYGNTASAVAAFVGSGDRNVASGNSSSVLCGDTNTASGFQSAILGGRNNSCTNDRSFALGDQNTVSGNTAMAVGANNTCSGINAIALSNRSLADRASIMAHAGGMFAATGDAQRIRAVLRCTTTTNAAVEMALDGGTTYLTIPSGKVMYGEIYVVGVRAGGADVAIYRAVYCAKNIGGTSTEVFSNVTTDAATGTSLEVATVDAGDYIRIRPTGVLNQNWRWVAKADLVEVAHG